MQYLSNANIITKDQVIENASLLIEEGQIQAINPVKPQGASELDLQNHFLMPGLIDLHGDGIEKMIEPRPGVQFPIDFALKALDQQVLSTGITTVYHALSFAGKELGVRSTDFACNIIRRIFDLQDTLQVDTRSHCRYEITAFEEEASLSAMIQEGYVNQLSLMDHTPGQGQFKTDESYESYLVKAYKNSPEEAKKLIAEKKEKHNNAQEYMHKLVTTAHDNSVILASHDDDSIERVQLMKDLGVSISEFPLDLEVAKASREHGLHTVFGSPNVVRGKSQSQGMRAQDAIEYGVASCLCSDYMHSAMLSAIFKLYDKQVLSLPQAVQLGTLQPAQALKEWDLGEIASGKRANLIAVHWDGNFPQVKGAWVNGICQLNKIG